MNRQVYFGQFGNPADITGSFSAPANALDNAEVLFAWYDGGYECGALVVYRKDGELFEVNGGHCSCYGLEDQWEPEQTNVAALALREGPQTYYADTDALLGWKEMLNELGAGNS